LRTKQKIKKEIEKGLIKFEEEKKIKELKIKEDIKFDFEKKNALIRKCLYLFN